MEKRNWARSANAEEERFRQGSYGLRPKRANRASVENTDPDHFDKPELNLLHNARTTPELGPFLQNRDTKATKDWFRLVW